MSKENYPIDIVISWVDGKDPKWQAERNIYAKNGELLKEDVGGDSRYLDNGLFKYVFRSIEKFAPWVNKVYLVTWGHLPSWLNTSCKKLVIVNHKDFIPKEYLPTFNSDTIALNLHRIKGLSEHFIYFNDDEYLLSKTKPSLFFKNGLPRDMAVNEILPADAPTVFWHNMYNNMILLNENFTKRSVIRKHPFKWYSPHYGFKNLIKNILLYPFNMFGGLHEPHLLASFLKNEFDYSWTNYYKFLDQTCKSKFRNTNGITEHFIRYQTMTRGHFSPLNKEKYGLYSSMECKKLPIIILSKKYKYICINDDPNADTIKKIINSFNTLLPNKSSFELN